MEITHGGIRPQRQDLWDLSFGTASKGPIAHQNLQACPKRQRRKARCHGSHAPADPRLALGTGGGGAAIVRRRCAGTPPRDRGLEIGETGRSRSDEGHARGDHGPPAGGRERPGSVGRRSDFGGPRNRPRTGPDGRARARAAIFAIVKTMRSVRLLGLLVTALFLPACPIGLFGDGDTDGDDDDDDSNARQRLHLGDRRRLCGDGPATPAAAGTAGDQPTTTGIEMTGADNEPEAGCPCAEGTELVLRPVRCRLAVELRSQVRLLLLHRRHPLRRPDRDLFDGASAARGARGFSTGTATSYTRRSQRRQRSGRVPATRALSPTIRCSRRSAWPSSPTA